MLRILVSGLSQSRPIYSLEHFYAAKQNVTSIPSSQITITAKTSAKMTTIIENNP